MERIYCLVAQTQAQYRFFLEEVGPKLDEAGLSFHIFRPGEFLPPALLDKEVKL